MTVRELIAELMKYDMDATVVVPNNTHGGTEYLPVTAAEHGRFVPYTHVSGRRGPDGEFYADGERYRYTGEGTPAVVIVAIH